MLVEIDFGKRGAVNATFDENYSDYNQKGTKITFVWAQGENVTEFIELATFEFEGELELGSINATITTYAFNQDNVESVNSSVIVINK